DFRRHARANIQARTNGKILAQRYVKKWLGVFANALVLGNFGHTDYLQPLPFDLKALADGIITAPILSGHNVVDDGHGKSRFVIGAGEFAAGKKRNAHGGEIAWANLIVLDGRLLLGRGLITVDGDRRGRKTAVPKRRASRQGHGLDTGKRLHADEELIVKGLGALRIVSSPAQVDGC